MNSHSKKRNTALLYEFLTRHISKCLLDDKKEDAQVATNIVKKYFSEGSPLKNELNLFKSILNSGIKTREGAQKLLVVARKSAGLMNSGILNEQKNNIIKDINYSLGKDVYKYKVPEYTSYASIQMLFNDSRVAKSKLNDFDKIKLEEFVLKKLVETRVKKPIQVNKQFDNTVYKLAIEKYFNKYKDKLTENQRKCIFQYTAFLISEDKSVFGKFLKEQHDKVSGILSEIKDLEILKNKDLTLKLQECRKKFSKINFQDFSQKNVMQILEFIKLADEVVT